MAIVNTELLMQELEDAGITNIWYDSNGGVTHDNASPAQLQQAAAILTAHNPAALSRRQTVEAARTAIAQGKAYLQRQLLAAAPDTPTQIVATIKPVVDANVHLTRLLTNQIALMNGAFGWTLDLNPATAQNRQRYLQAVEMVIALLT
jgi:hypothetical protein